VPVVSTRIAGIPELVEDGVSGFLVPPGDAEALAAAIERLLADSALRDRFGNAGRAVVQRDFNSGIEADRLHDILTGALRGEIAPVRASR
jgi:glycosyltransferase involved in cell wall biosynthesis